VVLNIPDLGPPPGEAAVSGRVDAVQGALYASHASNGAYLDITGADSRFALRSGSAPVCWPTRR
jgi:hypothetical protein